MLSFILVFLATLAADFCWTKYNIHSAAKHPHRAAMWSALIVTFGAFSFLSYVNDHKLTVAAIAGAYVGTWLAVWRELKGEKLPPEVVKDHVDLFAAANIHWSKDPAVPYMHCACQICQAARAPESTGIRHTHLPNDVDVPYVFCACRVCKAARDVQT